MAKRRTVRAGLLAGALVMVAARLSLAQSALRQRALEAYFANNPDSAATLFATAVRQHPRDASLHAWLAEASLRSGHSVEALHAADDALRLDSCNAQAHLVRASLFMPRYADRGRVNDDSTWSHLIEAVKCDSSDGNAWSYVWKYAIIRRDSAAESGALRALVTTGFLTRPQVTLARWVLQSLPPRAVLLTGGDLDTYGPLAVQIAMGVRPDVAVLNVVMLSALWYSKPMLARFGLHYDASVAGDSGRAHIVAWLRQQALRGALGRPLAFALTAAADTTTRDGALQLGGPYWLVVPAGAANVQSPKIAESLRNADSMDWRGPAVATSDRSPLHEPHPALIATRVALLDHALAGERKHELTRDREEWISNFLRRAGVDSQTINRTLKAFRAGRAR